MTPKSLRVFLDTSVIFVAVLSGAGGAPKLFHLGEAGFLELVVGSNVLRECEDVVQRKAPHSLPRLAQLLAAGQVQTSPPPSQAHIQIARTCVIYAPDALVLAEALQAEVAWFVTHDKAHFLKQGNLPALPFQFGTPGDLIQALQADL